MSEFTEVAFSEEIEGTLDGSSGLDLDSTLNEPISVTIQRDLTAIYGKFRYVIQPSKVVRVPGQQNTKIVSLLSDWDLWGPWEFLFKYHTFKFIEIIHFLLLFSAVVYANGSSFDVQR